MFPGMFESFQEFVPEFEILKDGDSEKAKEIKKENDAIAQQEMDDMIARAKAEYEQDNPIEEVHCNACGCTWKQRVHYWRTMHGSFCTIPVNCPQCGTHIFGG